MIYIADSIRSGERQLVGVRLTECRRSQGRQLVVEHLTDMVHPHDQKPHVVHPCTSNGQATWLPYQRTLLLNASA